MYIPCWTFDADAEADYIGKGGIIVHERDSKGNSRTRTRWHVVSGRVSRRFDDMLIVASGDRTAKLIDEADRTERSRTRYRIRRRYYPVLWPSITR